MPFTIYHVPSAFSAFYLGKGKKKADIGGGHGAQCGRGDSPFHICFKYKPTENRRVEHVARLHEVKQNRLSIELRCDLENCAVETLETRIAVMRRKLFSFSGWSIRKQFP